MYLYPDNLRAQATLWFWSLRDLTIFCSTAVFGILLLFRLGFLAPIVCSVLFAFLTIQFEGSTILSFIWCAVKYFMVSPQIYVWRER